MTNNEFKRILLEDSPVMSKQELEEIIENELNKSEEEMDADLIEYCLDSIKKLELSEENNEKEESKRIFFVNPKIWRVLIAMSVVLVFGITASAIYFNIPKNIAQLINGNAELDFNLENADTTADEYTLLETDLAKELESFGITPVTFPEAMIRKECKITKIENTTIDETISLDANVEFESTNYKGRFFVTKFKDDLQWSGSDTVMNVKSAEMININGIDIIIFEKEKSCTITYKDNLTEYTFLLECDFETAKEFAKTIK